MKKLKLSLIALSLMVCSSFAFAQPISIIFPFNYTPNDGEKFDYYYGIPLDKEDKNKENKENEEVKENVQKEDEIKKEEEKIEEEKENNDDSNSENINNEAASNSQNTQNNTNEIRANNNQNVNVNSLNQALDYYLLMNPGSRQLILQQIRRRQNYIGSILSRTNNFLQIENTRTRLTKLTSSELKNKLKPKRIN